MSLFDDLQNSTVDELNLRDAPSLGPDSTVRDAVLLMRDMNLGCVIIVNEQQQPVGIFNEAMLRSLLASNPSELDDPVATHMDKQVPYVFREDSVDFMLEALDNQNTRFLAVVDAEKKLQALAGQKGLMEFIASYYPYEVLVQTVNNPTPSSQEGA